MAPAAPVSQLWASIADLHSVGVSIETLRSKPRHDKLKALRGASSHLLTYVRSRYEPPLLAQVTRAEKRRFTPPLLAEYVENDLPLVPWTTGDVEVLGDPTEATSLAVRALATGPAAGLAVGWSDDGGYTWPAENVGTLDSNGALSLGIYAAGLTVHFTDTIQEGAVVFVEAGVEEVLRDHSVAVAVYRLVFNRGVDPNSPSGAALKQLYADADGWAKNVQRETAKLSERRDSTPNVRETRPRGGGQKNPWDFFDA